MSEIYEKVNLEIKQIENHLETHKTFIELSKKRIPDSTEKAAIVSILYSFFKGLERIFLTIIKEYDNEKKDLSQKELIKLMNKKNDKRGKVLSDKTDDIVLKYLELTHKLENIYDYQLDWDICGEYFINLNSNWQLIKKEVEDFIFFNNKKDNDITKDKNLFDNTDEIIESEKEGDKKTETAWQVARGAEIDFIQIQKLLKEIITGNKINNSLENIAKLLGYANEKVRGFTRLLYFMGLLEDKTRKPTLLSEIICQFDEYFEDTGTLWYLHYSISSNKNIIIWNGITNVLFNKELFSFSDATPVFEKFRDEHTDYSFKHQLRKEFTVCIKAYTLSEFKKLNIINRKSDDEEIFIKSSSISVADEVLLSIILLFKERFCRNEVAIEIKKLATSENSPGKLLYISENKLREALERLRIAGYIHIESFANLDQIKFLKPLSSLDMIKEYYKKKLGG
ncbi:MAG TPA: DUF4007 family protein [Spirochaetota bacterium]|nr:DUF4007 family protein [Spirochaetota bacterium]